MPVEDSGAFWNATIYSPRDPKMGPKLSLPLKSDLDPQTYGGYSSQQFAYFFIYEARDKKGRTVFRFAEVPVWLAPRIRVDEGALEAHARRLAEGEKLQFVGIRRAKLLKKQLIEIDGERFLITGIKKMRNATEIAFSLEEAGYLSNSMNQDDERLCAADLIDRVAVCGIRRMPRLMKLIKIQLLKENTVN